MSNRGCSLGLEVRCGGSSSAEYHIISLHPLNVVWGPNLLFLCQSVCRRDCWTHWLLCVGTVACRGENVLLKKWTSYFWVKWQHLWQSDYFFSLAFSCLSSCSLEQPLSFSLHLVLNSSLQFLVLEVQLALAFALALCWGGVLLGDCLRRFCPRMEGDLCALARLLVTASFCRISFFFFTPRHDTKASSDSHFQDLA